MINAILMALGGGNAYAEEILVDVGDEILVMDTTEMFLISGFTDGDPDTVGVLDTAIREWYAEGLSEEDVTGQLSMDWATMSIEQMAAAADMLDEVGGLPELRSDNEPLGSLILTEAGVMTCSCDQRCTQGCNIVFSASSIFSLPGLMCQPTTCADPGGGPDQATPTPEVEQPDPDPELDELTPNLWECNQTHCEAETMNPGDAGYQDMIRLLTK